MPKNTKIDYDKYYDFLGEVDMEIIHIAVNTLTETQCDYFIKWLFYTS